MNAQLALVYGLAAYAVFFVTFLYAIGFTGNCVVPKSLDSGPGVGPGAAIGVDLLLLGLFAVQHSVMARQGFKARWARLLPQPIERSTFVLLSSLLLLLLFWQWRPLQGVVWSVESPVGTAVLWTLFAAGWCVVFLSTVIIDHFDLFGVRQVLLHARGEPYTPPVFKVAAFYRWVRHPLLLGFIIAFWSTPTMTQGHLLFAAVTTAYMLVAVRLEERDLLRLHGADYEAYRQRVSMLIPWRSKPGA